MVKSSGVVIVSQSNCMASNICLSRSLCPDHPRIVNFMNSTKARAVRGFFRARTPSGNPLVR